MCVRACVCVCVVVKWQPEDEEEDFLSALDDAADADVAVAGQTGSDFTCSHRFRADPLPCYLTR